MDTTTANSNTAENTAKPFTFGFTKKLPTKLLTDSSLRDASTKNEQEEKDYVLDVDSHKGIHSTKPKEILKELVIPCEGNKYKFDKYNVKSTNKKGSQWCFSNTIFCIVIYSYSVVATSPNAIRDF